MIQANELRIGNWVQLENYTKYQIEPHHFQLNKDGYSEVLDLSIPIPLTEEIILKCGFENDDFCPEYNYYAIKYDEVADYWIHIQRKIGTEIFIFETNSSITQIQTVNQLQNLYFSLTNQELNIEL